MFITDEKGSASRSQPHNLGVGVGVGMIPADSEKRDNASYIINARRFRFRSASFYKQLLPFVRRKEELAARAAE